METTESNVKTAAEVLAVLAKNKCTVANAKDILHFCSKSVECRATVPEMDYLADFTERFLAPSP